MNWKWYVSIENDDYSQPRRKEKEIGHHENIDGVESEEESCHSEHTDNTARYHGVCSKENKWVWIFGIGQKIDTIDNTGEEKYTIVEQHKIDRKIKSIGNT